MDIASLPPDAEAPPCEPCARDRYRAPFAIALSILLHLLLVSAYLARPPGQQHPAHADGPAVQVALHAARTGQPGDTSPMAPLAPAAATASTNMPAFNPAGAPTQAATTAANNILPTIPAVEIATQPQPAPALTPALQGGYDMAFLAIVQQRYMNELSRWWSRQRPAYPDELRRAGIEGTVIVNATIDRNGQLVALSIAESSGNSMLDNAALETIRHAAPLPPPPGVLPYATTELALPVDLRLQ